MVTRLGTNASVIFCLAITLLISGCRDNDYADTINLSAGDAIARNKAVQTIDPWPRSAFKKHHSTNGQRISRAYDKYQGETSAEAPKKP